MDAATFLKSSLESLIAQNVAKRKKLKGKSGRAWKTLQRGEISGEIRALGDVNRTLKSILRQSARPRSAGA